jgi:hypothetical protein
MAVNDKPCNLCANYDPIKRLDKARSGRGWCAVKSIYPTVEPPERSFPPGVKRAEDGELAKPKIVVGKLVESHCAQFRAKS